MDQTPPVSIPGKPNTRLRRKHIEETTAHYDITTPNSATPERIPLCNISNVSPSQLNRWNESDKRTNVGTEPSILKSIVQKPRRLINIHSFKSNLENQFSFVTTDKPSSSNQPTRVFNFSDLVTTTTHPVCNQNSASTSKVDNNLKRKKQHSNQSTDHVPQNSDEDSDESELDEVYSSSSSDDDEPPYLSSNQIPLEGYHDIGLPLFECISCGAQMWYQERKGKSKHSASPTFQMCCAGGKVQLPLLPEAPPVLKQLLFDQNSSENKTFQQNIRSYNSMFAFTSPGMKIDDNINKGRGPPMLRIQGQTCHRIGSLLPIPGEGPKFGQLYIYDTDNEIDNRMKGFRKNKNITPQTVQKLSTMFDEHNAHSHTRVGDNLCPRAHTL